MTIKDIAKEAKVSVTTVSFVLNGKLDNISEETIKKVKAVADKFNYSPNPIAVGLVTRKTKTIGLIIPDIQNLFFSQMAKHIEGELIKDGYNLILCNTDDKYERDLKTIMTLANRNVDAIIFSPSTQSMFIKNQKKIVELLRKTNIPYLVIDREIDNLGGNMVVNDDLYGGYIATKHLLEHGHRRIGCITGPLNVSSAKKRYEGYIKALREFNLDINKDYIIEGDYHYNSGYYDTKALLSKDITAIFASNDLMAYGVYKACKEFNRKIPEEISVVGFDDLYFSSILDVPLTSVKQDVEQLSKKISAAILNKVSNNEDLQTIVFKPSLTIRNSVAKINCIREDKHD